MKKLLILLGTTYFLYLISKHILEELADQRFWEQEYEENPMKMIDWYRDKFVAGKSCDEISKELENNIDDQFNELHATPGYWDHVKETQSKWKEQNDTESN